MKDIGYDETERELARLESELHEAYQTAAVELQQKADDYFSYFAAAQEKQLKRLETGEIDMVEYTRWCTTHMLTGQRWQDAANMLADDLLRTNQIACGIVNNAMPQVYAINGNWQAYVIEHDTGIDTGYVLYNRQAVIRIVRDEPQLLPNMPAPIEMNIPADQRWNRKLINSCVLQGILQGDTSTALAGRLRKVSDMNERVSIRNARTMTTSAQNGGRLDGMLRAKEMGIQLKQMWVATLDGRTRHSHRQADGEKCEVGEKFSNGCRFPGDPDGDPSEVYNCRCSLVSVDPLFDDDASDLSKRYSEGLQGMTYEEWKAGKPTYTAESSSGKTERDDVNPDNPSYGYSGRNPARIKPGTAERSDTAAEITIPSDSTPGQYDDQPIQRKGLTTSGESGTMEPKTDKSERTLSQRLSTDYGLTVSPTFERLNDSACQAAFEGFEAITAEFPELLDVIHGVKAVRAPKNPMSCERNTLLFSFEYFSNPDALRAECVKQSGTHFWIPNSSPASTMVHECGHAFESLLIELCGDYEFDFQKQTAWADCSEAMKIISKAIAELRQQTGTKASRTDLIAAISRQSTRDDSEALAEAFADVYANGQSANPLSIIIRRLATETYLSYKQGGDSDDD